MKPLIPAREIGVVKFNKKPFSERHPYILSSILAPIIIAIIAFILRGDFVHVWRWLVR